MMLIYFVYAVLALGLLVFVHEWGHYLIAKKTGMDVEAFSIGFGRPLIQWRHNGVIWKLGWIPFGGFVKIRGMDFNQREEDIYSIEHGFFTSTPLQRIAVAAAGPCANFIFAALLLCGLWAVGGRERPFAEFTHTIGFVDPSSELYQKGVRPGDELIALQGNPYTQAKDLLYYPMITHHLTVQGNHIDLQHNIKTPFTYTVTPYSFPSGGEQFKTIGVFPARYLIYQPQQSIDPLDLPQSSTPFRLIWADGETLFSIEQLSSLLNDSKALLTIERGGETLLIRQKKIAIGDLYVDSAYKEEWKDLYYEMDSKAPFSETQMIPYRCSDELTIEETVPLLATASPDLYALQPGDHILAVDGYKVTSLHELLTHLQEKRIQMILTPWKELGLSERAPLLASSDIQALTQFHDRNSDLPSGYILVEAVPKKVEDLPLSAQAMDELKKHYELQKKKIAAIQDPEQREEEDQLLEASLQRYVLGIGLQDRMIRYNPKPWVLFSSIFSETYTTIKALFSGSLHPKWVSGPVGIIQVMHKSWALGWREGVFWVCMISVNLGFLNLLPIPVLDGGYICFSLWEMVTRRKLQARTMERLVIPCVIILVGFLIFLTFQDIIRMFSH